MEDDSLCSTEPEIADAVGGGNVTSLEERDSPDDDTEHAMMDSGNAAAQLMNLNRKNRRALQYQLNHGRPQPSKMRARLADNTVIESLFRFQTFVYLANQPHSPIHSVWAL